LRVTTVTAVNAENGSGQTVPRISATTLFAFAAAGVYLADDAFSDKVRPRRRIFHNANEFMADRSFEAGISPNYFQVRIANAGHRDTHQYFTVRIRHWRGFVQKQLSVHELKCLHTVD